MPALPPPPLLEEHTYHIFNRGNNGETLFLNEYDYWRFIDKYYQYCHQAMETFAYCLMRNHFHLLVRIRSADEQQRVFEMLRHNMQEMWSPFKVRCPSMQLSHLCNSHAQSVNKRYKRTGNLFERPFKRVPVVDSDYFLTALCYIHWNPERHRAVQDFRLYPYSSYQNFYRTEDNWVNTVEVLDRFGGIERFRESHNRIALLWDPGEGMETADTLSGS